MPLPFPVRIAAGLVATAVEQARDLPRLVIEFPITAVSQALQASMRVQQRVTELAIKGDRALGVLRPVEEKPSWATFDEDEPPARNGTSTVTELRPSSRVTPAPVAPEVDVVDVDELDVDELDIAEPDVDELDVDELVVVEVGSDELDAEQDVDVLDDDEPVASETLVIDADADLADLEAAVDVAEPVDTEPAVAEPVITYTSGPEVVTAETLATDDPDTEVAGVDVAEVEAPEVPVERAAEPPVEVEDDEDLPPALPDYANMTIPQLRGKLRFLSLADLRALLAWEESHGERPPFLTMLSNRITTVLEG